MNDTHDKIISDREFRFIYGVSATTTFRLRSDKNNPLPHFFVRGQVRYRLSEVKKFFEENAKRKQ